MSPLISISSKPTIVLGVESGRGRRALVLPKDEGQGEIVGVRRKG